MFSAASRPGSRRCVCRSTKPGPTQQSRTSTSTASPGASIVGPTSAIVPSMMRTSPIESRRSHDETLAQDDAHFDSPDPATLKYRTAMRIGTPLATCCSTIAAGASTTRESTSTPRFIGPGCMISVSGRIAAKRSTVKPCVNVNSSRLGTNAPGPSLRLEAEQSHHIGPVEGRIEVGGDGDRPLLDVVGQQRARGADANLSAERRVRRDVASRDPTVTDVAHDQDAQPLEQFAARFKSRGPTPLAQNLADREGVQETLGRVLVLSVTGVDDAHVRHVAAHLERGAAGTVTKHDGVDAQSVDGRDRVAK